MAHKASITLNRFISRHFLRAALVPLLVIELALVLLYFGVNYYIDRKTVRTLESVSTSHLQNLATDQAEKIGDQLKGISAIGTLLQKECTRFFTEPALFTKPAVPARFTFAPNGVYYKAADNGGSSLYYSTQAAVGERQKKKALDSEALDAVLKYAVESNKTIVAAYLNTFDSMNRYYPFIKDVFSQYPADMNIPTYNFYYLADASHNPERRVVWTDAYLDPAGQGWMMSCIAPVYRGTFLEGVIGIDVTIDRFIKNLLDLTLPWHSKAFLVDRNGTIMAMPPDVEKVLGLTELRTHVYEGQVQKDTFKQEEFNLLKSKFASVASAVGGLIKKPSGIAEISIQDKFYYLAQATVPEANWKLLILASEDEILSPVNRLKRHSRAIGYAAVVVMVIFYFLFFMYLFRKTTRMASTLSEPVEAIVQASNHLARGDYSVNLPPSQIEELSHLASSFTTMAARLEKYSIDLEAQVLERTAELRETQAKLLHKDKMASIGQLAAGIAHEINNPLGFITSNLRTLREYHANLLEFAGFIRTCSTGLAEDSGTSKDVAERIAAQRKALDIDEICDDLEALTDESLIGGERIKNIVANLKDFSHIDIQTLNPEQINDLLESTIAVVSNDLKYRAELHREYGTLPTTVCNGGQLNQVFLSLLINASQAIAGRGEITVRTWHAGSDIFVAIHDTGCGIPEEHLPRIFEPFFTTREVGQGAGLGLSISYDIIRNHRGEIFVKSTPGEGATFTIRLPVEGAEEAGDA